LHVVDLRRPGACGHQRKSLQAHDLNEKRMQVCHFFATTGCKHPQGCTKGCHDERLVLAHLDSIVCKRLALQGGCSDEQCKKSHFPAIVARFKDELAKSDSHRAAVVPFKAAKAPVSAARPASARASTASLSLVRAQAPPLSSHGGMVVPKLQGMGMKPTSKGERKTEVLVKQKRRKTNVVVALDVGSSMAGANMEVAKLELKKLRHLLCKGDSLSILTFAAAVSVSMPRRFKWQPKDGQAKRETQFDERDLDCVIEGLQANGSTALYDALAAAIQVIQQTCESDMLQHPHSDWHTYQLLVITTGVDTCSKTASAASVNATLMHPGPWASKCHFSSCFVVVTPEAATALQPCLAGLKHAVTVTDIEAGFRRLTETVAEVKTTTVQKLKKSTFEWGKVFNPIAGQTRFDKSIPRDQFRNVVGQQYDLSPDGVFCGNKVAVYAT
jgi:uncharacterized protein YegL